MNGCPVSGGTCRPGDCQRDTHCYGEVWERGREKGEGGSNSEAVRFLSNLVA